MKYKKSTRYALYAVMEMAAAPDIQVSAAEVAERYDISPTVLAKVLQELVRAGIAVGTRGAGGGYQLAEKASKLTVLDVIEVFEPPRDPGAPLLNREDGSPTDPRELRLQSIFDEVDELVRSTFASITLETLVSGRTPLDRAVRATVRNGTGSPTGID